jgi:hypothetical protein
MKSESFQNTVNSILSWFKNIDWLKVSQTLDINSKFCDEIIQQLEAKNIDISLLNEFNLSQIAELYIASNQAGLTFSDLIEDNIQLFGKFESVKAQAYLDIINKRKNQVLENAGTNLNVNEGFVENLKYSENNIAGLIELALKEYEKNNIFLEDKEIRLLNAYKLNKFVQIKDLTKILAYQPKEIEELSAGIRKKFNIDYFDDDNVKRNLLISLAKNIVIK